jgi:hypothetical protein
MDTRPTNLSDEGEELWNNLDNEDYLNKLRGKKPVDKKKTRRDLTKHRIGLLQENSLQVYNSCQRLIQVETARENYFKANEAKVAAMIHKNFYDRLQRILDGEDPMESEQITKEQILVQ